MFPLRRKLVRAYTETRRILRVTRKPRRQEYNKTAKVTGLGTILIGIIGFIIFLISQLLQS